MIARIDAEEAQRKAQEQALRSADEHAARDIEARAEKARDLQPVRLHPETAFSDVKGRLPLPVAGTILKAFGSSDGLGGRSTES